MKYGKYMGSDNPPGHFTSLQPSSWEVSIEVQHSQSPGHVDVAKHIRVPTAQILSLEVQGPKKACAKKCATKRCFIIHSIDWWYNQDMRPT